MSSRVADDAEAEAAERPPDGCAGPPPELPATHAAEICPQGALAGLVTPLAAPGQAPCLPADIVRAAATGDHEATLLLAALHEEGAPLAVPQSWAAAGELYGRAMLPRDSDNAPPGRAWSRNACFGAHVNLAILLVAGVPGVGEDGGGPADIARADDLLRKVAFGMRVADLFEDAPHWVARFRYARALVEAARGDDAEADRLLASAAAGGCAQAAVELALRQRRRRSPVAEREAARARAAGLAGAASGAMPSPQLNS